MVITSASYCHFNQIWRHLMWKCRSESNKGSVGLLGHTCRFIICILPGCPTDIPRGDTFHKCHVCKLIWNITWLGSWVKLKSRHCIPDFSIGGRIWTVEMGRSAVDAEVRPKDLAECSARFGSATWEYSAEVRPNFGQHSTSLWLRINGVLRSPLALIKVNTLTISY